MPVPHSHSDINILGTEDKSGLRLRCSCIPQPTKPCRCLEQACTVLPTCTNQTGIPRSAMTAYAKRVAQSPEHSPLRHGWCMQGAKRTVQKGELKPIVVAMEDRQGGRKHITRVAYFEPFGLDPDELAGVLQRKFQVCSGQPGCRMGRMCA